MSEAASDTPNLSPRRRARGGRRVRVADGKVCSPVEAI